jgi:hypothetical protein
VRHETEVELGIVHDERFAREDREERVRVHLRAVDEPASRRGRERDESGLVRAGIDPRGLEVDAYYLRCPQFLGYRLQLIFGS